MDFGDFRFFGLLIVDLALLLLIHIRIGAQQRLVNTITTPIDDQGLTDAEQHDGDLGDGEEAPDGGLFHQIGSDQTGQVGPECEQKDSLDDHPFLLIQRKEGSKHQERMDGGARDDVSGIRHGHRPGKMVISSISADFFSSEPFGGGKLDSLLPKPRNQKASKQHSSANKTKSLNDGVFVQVFLILGERSVDDMTEVRLEANVQESQDGQNLVDDRIAERGIDVRRDEEVLNELEELHREEEENSRGEFSVVGARIDPIRGE